MTYHHFKTSDEVAIRTSGYGNHNDKFAYLTVERLAGREGAMVVLSDGSKWRHDGRKWGDASPGYMSKFEPLLVSAKDAREWEKNNAAAVQEHKNRRHWESQIAALNKLNPMYRKAETAKILRDLLGWVEALPEQKG